MSKALVPFAIQKMKAPITFSYIANLPGPFDLVLP